MGATPAARGHSCTSAVSTAGFAGQLFPSGRPLLTGTCSRYLAFESQLMLLSSSFGTRSNR